MVLTREIILKEIQLGNIEITPFNKNNIGPASVDLTLDNKFRVFKKDVAEYNVTEKADANQVTKAITANKMLLKPGDFILGVTKEKLNLADNICCSLQGRSRFARLGVAVHITASFLQPGINNKQVLEIKNVSPVPLWLHAGTKICQAIFYRTEGRARYRGRYQRQRGV